MRDWPEEAFGAYLAAMIDGEGHIEIISDYSVRIRIANTIRPTLAAMRDRLGFGRVIEYKRPADGKFKRLFCLEVSSAGQVKQLFDLCGHYVHMKPDQMRAALRIVDRVLSAASQIDVRNKAIFAAVQTGRVQNEIARDFGVSPQLVSHIKKGHTWSSVITAHRARALAKSFPRGQSQVFRLHGAPK